MKSIKKISLLAVAAVLSISFASAQVGIQAGFSQSKSAATNSEALNGFHVGPVYNLSIQGPISLQYGLLYNYLTHKNEVTVRGVTGKSTTTAHAVDVPVRVAGSFPLTSNVKLYVFGGPNFNFGVSQKTTGSVSSSIGGGSIESKNIYELEMANGKKAYSPFDLQLGVGGGIQFNNIGIRVGYDWGMLDRDNHEVSEWKNNDLKASLVVNF